jgi:5-methylcytosine-specific restriction endonuclease McrA
MHKKEAAAYRATRREKSAAYRTARREESKARDAIYRAEHRKEINAYAAAYREAHREKARVYERAWAKKYPDRVNAYGAARRAVILGATVGNLVEIREIYRRAREDPRVRCYLCGKLIPMNHRHVDHIMPLSKGGAHRPSNLAATCDQCNRGKHNKLPNEVGILI